MNSLGETVRSGNFTGVIDVHELASGIYFLLLTDETGKTGTVKFVKE